MDLIGLSMLGCTCPTKSSADEAITWKYTQQSLSVFQFLYWINKWKSIPVLNGLMSTSVPNQFLCWMDWGQFLCQINSCAESMDVNSCTESMANVCNPICLTSPHPHCNPSHGSRWHPAWLPLLFGHSYPAWMAFAHSQIWVLGNSESTPHAT